MAIFTAAVALVSTFGAWFGTLSVFAQVGIRFAAGLAFNALSRALSGKPEGPREPGIVGEIQQGADIGRSFLVGVRATAGSLVYHNQWGGSENEYYTRITAISDLPIDGLVEIWVDGKLYQIDSDNPHADFGWPILGLSEEKSSTAVEFFGFVADGARNAGDKLYKSTDVVDQIPCGWIKFFDGSQTVSDTFVSSKVATDERPWSANEVGVGVAYAVTTFKISRKLFQGIPQILFVCKGIKMLDRASGLTAHSENPIVQADALLSGLKYGGEWFYGPQSGTRLKVSEVSAEIAKCNAPVPGASSMNEAERIAAFGSSTIPARYRSSLEVQLDRPVADVLEDIISACNGRISEVGTRYRIQVGDPDLAVLSITDADFRSTQGQSFAPFFPLADTVNAITATYPAPAEGWQSQDAPPLYRSDLEASDGNRRLPTGVQLSAVPFPEQVQRLMASALAEARRARRHSGTLPARLWRLEPGDFVEWTSVRHGYDTKLWRIDGLTDLQNGDLAVDLNEVNPDDYDRDASIEFKPVIPGSLSGVVQVPVVLEDWDVEGVSVGDGTSLRPGLQFTWTPPASDVFSGISYQIRLTSDQRVTASGFIAEVGQGFDLVSGMFLAATGYEARGRYVTTQRSIWTAWKSVVTPDVRLVAADFDDVVVEQLETIAETVGRVDLIREDFDADVRARVPVDLMLNTSLESISARVTDLLIRLSDTQSRIARAGVYVDEVDGSVKIEGVKSLEGALFETRISINEIAGAITLFASKQFVQEQVANAVLDPSQIPLLDEIITQLNQVELDLSSANAAIIAKADVLVVSAQGARLSAAELKVLGLEGAVALKANTNDVTALVQRVTDAEIGLSTIDGAGFAVALTDIQSLRDNSEASAAADLGSILRDYEEGVRRRADVAAATLDLFASVSDAREAIAGLKIELGVAVEDARARVLQEASTRVAADAAEASARLALAAELSHPVTGLPSTRATLSDLAITTAAADSALAQRSGALEATVNNPATGLAQTRADLQTVDTTRADGDSALAQRASTLEATVNDGSTGLAATRATLSDLATTRVTAEGAVSAVSQAISASYNSLDALATATAFAKSGVDGLLSGFQWEAVSDGVAGQVRLTSNGVASQFLVSADDIKFIGDFIDLFADEVRIPGDLIVGGNLTRGYTGFQVAAALFTGAANAAWSNLFLTIGELDFDAPVSRSGTSGQGELNPVVLEFSATCTQGNASPIVFSFRAQGRAIGGAWSDLVYFSLVSNNGGSISPQQLLEKRVLSASQFENVDEVRMQYRGFWAGGNNALGNSDNHCLELKQVTPK
jgi:hypothetical protein